jgi:hypothetical protein
MPSEVVDELVAKIKAKAAEIEFGGARLPPSTRSTPIAIAAVRLETPSFFARHDLASGTAEHVFKATHHLVLCPEVLLKTLYLLEVADDHAAGVAQNVGDNENPIVRWASTRLASSVVGPFAPSAITGHCSFAATSASITRSTARGARISQRRVSSSTASIVA